ncbi:uncharacterized protein LOC126077377 [Elephas maximus indicus]|uniref:uncharacterized protein LOC126077377 n=1 Tax=Elephas maximus indicus TaxID=99487 RepID=UPI0021161270|nr:uncharacterized protein LOC126077377 [Elephas maximus indicus]
MSELPERFECRSHEGQVRQARTPCYAVLKVPTISQAWQPVTLPPPVSPTAAPVPHLDPCCGPVADTHELPTGLTSIPCSSPWQPGIECQPGSGSQRPLHPGRVNCSHAGVSIFNLERPPPGDSQACTHTFPLAKPHHTCCFSSFWSQPHQVPFTSPGSPGEWPWEPCFTDYAKAFNCVDHNKIWITLQRMGIPECLIVLMRNLYIDQEAVVQTEQGDTDWFEVRKGVCQGCILSPYLFNLCAEQIIREAGLYEEEQGIRIGGRLINNPRYADDTTLLAESEEDLKHLLMEIKDHSLQYRLHLSIKKTKILTTGVMSNSMINRDKIEVIKDFILHGSTINSHGSSSQEIKRHIALGKSAAKDLLKC